MSPNYNLSEIYFVTTIIIADMRSLIFILTLVGAIGLFHALTRPTLDNRVFNLLTVSDEHGVDSFPGPFTLDITYDMIKVNQDGEEFLWFYRDSNDTYIYEDVSYVVVGTDTGVELVDISYEDVTVTLYY